MRYDGLLNNRRDFIKLSEHAIEVAQNTKDQQLLEFADLAILFKYMLDNWMHVFMLITAVQNKWARIVMNEIESYKAWNEIQEQHIKAYRANAEYEYEYDCHILKNTPKTYYDVKHVKPHTE